MNQKSLKIEKIDQISINVKDVKRAVEFYKDILELELKFTAGNMAFLDCGGNTIMLSVPENEEFDHPSSVLYFKVQNMEESFQLLKDRGVKFRGKPHIVHKTTTMENWMVFFEDIDSNVLALTSHVKLS